MRQPPAGWQTVTPAPRSLQRRLQQPDGPVHGSPPCVQPPGASSQRPACVAVAPAQSPEQQSWERRQTSPKAWQAAWTVQTPPWQLEEQHSVPAAQALPSVLQTWPVPLSGTATQALGEPEQLPLQQSPFAEQRVPVVWHRAAPQAPPVQAREQHSPLATHGWPGALQKASLVQAPPAQAREQHWSRLVQASPVPLQVVAGGVVQVPDGLQ